MDVIRFSYSSEMVFRDGDPSVPIYWFRASPDAKVFPGMHAFASTVYDTDDEWGPLGERQSARRVWSNSQKPAVLAGHFPFVGELDWYQSGQPVSQLTGDSTLEGEPEPCACEDVIEEVGCGGLRGSGTALYGFPQPPLTPTVSSWFRYVPCPYQQDFPFTLTWNGVLGQFEGTHTFVNSSTLKIELPIRALHQSPVTGTFTWSMIGGPQTQTLVEAVADAHHLTYVFNVIGPKFPAWGVLCGLFPLIVVRFTY